MSSLGMFDTPKGEQALTYLPNDIPLLEGYDLETLSVTIPDPNSRGFYQEIDYTAPPGVTWQQVLQFYRDQLPLQGWTVLPPTWNGTGPAKSVLRSGWTVDEANFSTGHPVLFAQGQRFHLQLTLNDEVLVNFSTVQKGPLQVQIATTDWRWRGQSALNYLPNDIPLMPDYDLETLYVSPPDFSQPVVNYETPLGITWRQILKFYRDQLPLQGWTVLPPAWYGFGPTPAPQDAASRDYEVWGTFGPPPSYQLTWPKTVPDHLTVDEANYLRADEVLVAQKSAVTLGLRLESVPVPVSGVMKNWVGVTISLCSSDPNSPIVTPDPEFTPDPTLTNTPRCVN